MSEKDHRPTEDGAPVADDVVMAQRVGAGEWTRANFLKRAGLVSLGAGVSGAVLAACGSSGGATTASGEAPAATTTAAGGGSISSKLKKKKIGFVHFTEADENEKAIAQAFKEAIDQAGLEWEVKEADSQGVQGKAEQAVSVFVNEGVDAIVLCVVAARLVEAQLEQAKQKNIPVFGMWTFSELDPKLVTDYTPLAASEAAALAQYMYSDLYTKKPEGDIKIALLDSDLDVIQTRSVTVRAIGELYPRAEIVDTADVDLENITSSSSSIAQGFLSKTSDLDAIWNNYPPTVSPTVSAVEQRGLTDQIGVYGHVAESVGIEELENESGALKACSWCDFDWQSYHMLGLMLQYFNGEEVSRLASYEDICPIDVITQKNVEIAQGEGTAAGYGWTILRGTWKPAVVAEWKEKFGGK